MSEASEILDRLRSALTFGRLSEFEKTAFETYRRHRVEILVGGGVAANPYQTPGGRKTFEAEGDHLTITYVSGGTPLYVRVGSPENPFIRMREGLVIKRRFRSIEVRTGAHREHPNLYGVMSLAHAEFFTSFGELLVLPAKDHGIGREFFAHTFNLSAGTGLSNLLDDLVLSDDLVPTVGRHGGTVVIKNADLAATLYLRQALAFYTSLFPGTDGFELSPGEAITLQLADVFALAGRRLADGSSLQELHGPFLSASAYPCRVSILCSSFEVDAGAPEQELESRLG